MAIPVSVIGTFALLDASGVSLNIMSLGGLALGVGMLVDNSIVVLENIFRHRELGQAPWRPPPPATEEVTGAITASTLTTIAVFGPIIYVEGVAGELFRDLSLAVAFSLMASLLVAFTLLPALAARFGGGEVKETLRPARSGRARAPGRLCAASPGWWRSCSDCRLWIFQMGKAVARELLLFWWGGIRRLSGRLFRRPLDAFDRGYQRFEDVYHRCLEWSLERRGARARALGARAGRDLRGRDDRSTATCCRRWIRGRFEVGLELQEGLALERDREVARGIEQVLLEDPDVEAVFGTVGRDARRFAQSDDATGLHTARFQVRLREGAPTDEVVNRLRDRLDAAASGRVVTVITGQATALGQMLGGVGGGHRGARARRGHGPDVRVRETRWWTGAPGAEASPTSAWAPSAGSRSSGSSCSERPPCATA